MDADAIDKAPDAAAAWPDQIYGLLKKHDIRQVALVPDAGHSRLIERCRADPQIRDVVLTTEEEGVAMAAGAWLGGERAALLMQSSGVGNTLNAIGSLLLGLYNDRGELDHVGFAASFTASERSALKTVIEPLTTGLSFASTNA